MVVGRKRGGPVAGLPTTSDLWANDAGGSDEWRCAVPGSDVRVITSGGRAIEAHSSVLAAASPVLEARLFRRPPKRHHDGSAILPITGVPCDAVLAFLRCLYHGKTAASWLSPHSGHDGSGSSNHAVHLLVLSHAMRVPWLKRAAESALASSLRAEDVADLLQLSRLCDAARLKVRCLNYIRKDPEAVEATEGWRLLRRCDPRIEAEVARFVKDAQKREQRRRKRREENTAYVELGHAVECLHHILREGCGGVGPKDSKQLPPGRRPPAGTTPMDVVDGCCRWGRTCEGIRALIRHYATCQQRTSRRRDADSSLAGGSGCGRCGRIVQLLRLHAAVSFELDHPMPQPMSSVCILKPEDEDGNGIKWRLLARKVVCAKLMSALTLSKRKREYADEGCPRANSRPWRNQGAAA